MDYVNLFLLTFVPVNTYINATAFCRSPTGILHRSVHKLSASRWRRSAAARRRQGTLQLKSCDFILRKEPRPGARRWSTPVMHIQRPVLTLQVLHPNQSMAPFISAYAIRLHRILSVKRDTKYVESTQFYSRIRPNMWKLIHSFKLDI
jgi:hypothetical protein